MLQSYSEIDYLQQLLQERERALDERDAPGPGGLPDGQAQELVESYMRWEESAAQLAAWQR